MLFLFYSVLSTRYYLLVLIAELKNREWVAGDKISVADITLLIGVGWAKVAKYELDPAWTNLIRWYDTMKARPSAKA